MSNNPTALAQELWNYSKRFRNDGLSIGVREEERRLSVAVELELAVSANPQRAPAFANPFSQKPSPENSQNEKT